ncbi:MAG: hypothetical protein KF912_07165 [Phycisphaeraceae bacterium]|nr:hypothetical protein [Phycisphaeraceae bacterium]
MLACKTGLRSTVQRWVRSGVIVAAALVLGACSGNRTMMVMVRDAASQAAVPGADVNVRSTQGTSISRFDRTRTLTGEDGSILIDAPIRQALQITVQTEDGSYARFVIDHPALGVTTPWTSPGAIGYEHGPRKFQISAIEWQGGKHEQSARIPWREPTPNTAP